MEDNTDDIIRRLEEGADDSSSRNISESGDFRLVEKPEDLLLRMPESSGSQPITKEKAAQSYLKLAIRSLREFFKEFGVSHQPSAEEDEYRKKVEGQIQFYRGLLKKALKEKAPIFGVDVSQEHLRRWEAARENLDRQKETVLRGGEEISEWLHLLQSGKHEDWYEMLSEEQQLQFIQSLPASAKKEYKKNMDRQQLSTWLSSLGHEGHSRLVYTVLHSVANRYQYSSTIQRNKYFQEFLSHLDQADKKMVA